MAAPHPFCTTSIIDDLVLLNKQAEAVETIFNILPYMALTNTFLCSFHVLGSQMTDLTPPGEDSTM